MGDRNLVVVDTASNPSTTGTSTPMPPATIGTASDTDPDATGLRDGIAITDGDFDAGSMFSLPCPSSKASGTAPLRVEGTPAWANGADRRRVEVRAQVRREAGRRKHNAQGMTRIRPILPSSRMGPPLEAECQSGAFPESAASRKVSMLSHTQLYDFQRYFVV